jgi:hypothetical protein
VISALSEARRELQPDNAVPGIEQALRRLGAVVTLAAQGKGGRPLDRQEKAEAGDASAVLERLDHHLLLIGPVRNMEFFISEVHEGQGWA